jgi:hypothetical protein
MSIENRAPWEPMRLQNLGDVTELVMGGDSIPGGDGKLSIPASTDPSPQQQLKKPPGQ